MLLSHCLLRHQKNTTLSQGMGMYSMKFVHMWEKGLFVQMSAQPVVLELHSHLPQCLGPHNLMATACSVNTITGCESQHGQVGHKIINHLTTKRCWHLLENYTPLDDTLEEYVQHMGMHRDGV